LVGAHRSDTLFVCAQRETFEMAGIDRQRNLFCSLQQNLFRGMVIKMKEVLFVIDEMRGR
jgi:hypothetical protein